VSKSGLELTAAEWAIIHAVWDHEPCTAPDIQEILQHSKGWAYSTVKTLMDRMVAKGLLRPERIRNLILYRSVVTRNQAQAGEVLKTVRRAFNGAMTPMMQFLLDNGGVTEKGLNELEMIIKAKKQDLKGKRQETSGKRRMG